MITRATATHMSSYFDKPRPQQRSGRENQSGHMASLVICYNSGLTWSVWSYRPLSTAARATGSQSSSLCKCVCMCVRWKSWREGVSCLAIFRPDWSEWVVILLLSWISPPPFHLKFAAWRQNDTLLQLEMWHHLRLDACACQVAHPCRLWAFFCI